MMPISIKQISASIQYFKQQFPQTFKEFQTDCGGLKLFQQHLKVINDIFQNTKYIQLRIRVIDILLAKIYLITGKNDYLQGFQAFLLQQLVKICVSNLVLLEDNKKDKQTTDRYTILLWSIISIIKYFAITSKKSIKNMSSQNLKFHQQSSYLINSPFKIISKPFINVLLQNVNKMIHQGLQKEIYQITKIYPQLYTVLMQILLNDLFGILSIGNKNAGLVIDIISYLIQNNKQNIWSGQTQPSISIQPVDHIKTQLSVQLKNKLISISKLLANPSQKAIQSQPTNQSKYRLLLSLQTILQKLININNQTNQQVRIQGVLVRQNRGRKFAIFLMQLIQISWQKHRYLHYNKDKYDSRIIKALALLLITIDQQPYQLLNKSQFIRQLQTQSKHNIIIQIQQSISCIFLQKLQKLSNKNNTISSSKTLILKQLSRLSSFLSTSQMSSQQLQDCFLNPLKTFFKPTNKILQKPRIIVQSQTYQGGSVPLIRLGKWHSTKNYQGYDGLQDMLRRQEIRYLLEKTRLFQFFQGESTNFTLFKLIIHTLNKQVKIKLFSQIANFFLISQSKNMNIQKYGLQMGIQKFYEHLLNIFYMHLIISSNQKSQFPQLITKNFKNYPFLLPKIKQLFFYFVMNNDTNKLLITSADEELLVFWSLNIIYALYEVIVANEANPMKRNYYKVLMLESILIHRNHSTYLLQALNNYLLLDFSQPQTIQKCLLPLQTTLIHRNNVPKHRSSSKKCNLHIIQCLIWLCQLSLSQCQQLINLYLSHPYHNGSQSTDTLIFLLYPKLSIQSMRKCVLTIKNWPLIFSNKQNLFLLNNKQMKAQDKAAMFHANDQDNVTVTNALGVVVIQLGDKWHILLQFKNPNKQILLDAMINLIQVNQQLVFWKRYFFQNILNKITSILLEIHLFINNSFKNQRTNMFDRLRSKIFTLLNKIPSVYYKNSLSLNDKIEKYLQNLKQIITKQHNFLKRQCFINEKFEKYIDQYKITTVILDKLDEALTKQTI